MTFQHWLGLIQQHPALALACVELPGVNVKGIRTAVRIYEVPWRQDASGAPVVNASPATVSGHDTDRLRGAEPGAG